MRMPRRKLEELNLLDDFLFHAMLAYPDTGEAFIRKLLETLFDRKFPHLKIRAQESFAGVNTDFRGARLDQSISEASQVLSCDDRQKKPESRRAFWQDEKGVCDLYL